jgi:hypothetical protein
VRTNTRASQLLAISRVKCKAMKPLRDLSHLPQRVHRGSGQIPRRFHAGSPKLRKAQIEDTEGSRGVGKIQRRLWKPLFMNWGEVEINICRICMVHEFQLSQNSMDGIKVRTIT